MSNRYHCIVKQQGSKTCNGECWKAIVGSLCPSTGDRHKLVIYVCIYVCIYVFTYIYMYIYIKYITGYLYIYIYNFNIYIKVFIYNYALHTHIYINVCMYIYIHIYIHVHPQMCVSLFPENISGLFYARLFHHCNSATVVRLTWVSRKY